jgi:amino acid transporter
VTADASESASISSEGGPGEPGSKGLKAGALGFVSSVVIGVASTAPGYSLAASLGLVAAVVGYQAPAIMWMAFVPMLFIAAAYYYMNRADPDCGTTFSWVTRALGPYLGWMGGWAILIADIIVMANLAEIASLYTFYLFGIEEPDAVLVLALGVGWITLMTWITWIGIEVSARTQLVLLSAEIVALAIFAVVALGRVYLGDVPGSVQPSVEWLDPFAISDMSAVAVALIIALFIYWGWDSTVAVNEESRDATESPGRAALTSTIILVLVYVIVSVAALAYQGLDFVTLEENQDDVLAALGTLVLGSPLDLVIIIAVLTSAAASTQTTILPTSRTVLSMASKGALPGFWARIDPRYLTPGPATIGFGVASVAWYVGLSLISTNILYDAIAALGLMIAFYLGLTGFACAVYYRHELRKSARNLLFVGVAPVVGGLILTWALVQSLMDLTDPANSESGDAWFGVGPPVVIAVGLMALGVALMVYQRITMPEFFSRRPEVADPRVLGRGATVAPPRTWAR